MITKNDYNRPLCSEDIQSGVFLGPLANVPPSAKLERFAAFIPGTELPTKDVTILWIPRGVTLAEPIGIDTTGEATTLVIICEKNSKALVCDRLAVVPDKSVHHVLAYVEDEAELTVLTVCTSKSSLLTLTQHAEVGNNASIRWQNVTLEQGNVEHDLRSRVVGEGGESTVDWIFYAHDTDKQNLHVINVFDGREGTGEITMRGIADEKSHAVCNGKIDIGLHGGGTNTYLTQEVLMLDSSAKVDAIPGLEIKTNDVKASHSATIARVTEEDLFYFAARGIIESEARRMYVLGFLSDLTQRITHPEWREMVMESIEQKYS